MKNIILLSALCTVATHAADRQPSSTKVYVDIENTAIFKNKANPNQNVWDVAYEIAKKHNLTITGLYYFQPNTKKPTLIPSHLNYSLQWHQIHRLPLYISAKHNPHSWSPSAI